MAVLRDLGKTVGRDGVFHRPLLPYVGSNSLCEYVIAPRNQQSAQLGACCSVWSAHKLQTVSRPITELHILLPDGGYERQDSAHSRHMVMLLTMRRPRVRYHTTKPIHTTDLIYPGERART